MSHFVTRLFPVVGYLTQYTSFPVKRVCFVALPRWGSRALDAAVSRSLTKEPVAVVIKALRFWSSCQIRNVDLFGPNEN